MNWKELNNKFFGRRNMTVANNTNSTAYPAEMMEIIIATYVETPTRQTVEELAAEFDKPVRGIITKLSQNGVYQKQENVSMKAGTTKPVVRKSDLVEKIQNALGGVEFTALEKASKSDLVVLLSALEK